ncbi:MAG TPA: YjfB family protein [Noviherbaspirillum sp.]|nr:YjfB family protein [Noviherbaspirillum sp.]
MEIGAIANLATSMQAAATRQDVEMAVLKKALDMQAAGGAALLDALPPPAPASNLPPHLGQNIDTTA